MMAAKIILALAIAAMPGAGSAAMQAAPAACPAAPAPLPRPWSGWSRALPIIAAATPAGLASATLTIGGAVRATLIPIAGVRYSLVPGKPAAPASTGGLFGLEVSEPGTYRVALDASAWIDVVRAGKSIVSTAHAHGPDCSGIRKIVNFGLTPGHYVIQVSGNAGPTIGIMVVKAG